jgi:hypothetical protein
MVSAPQTPQAAALAFLHPRIAHARTNVRIIAQTPNCAVLQFDHALIESNLLSGQILVRKFSFGWQATATSETNKIICSAGSSVADKCEVGPADDISAVRASMAGATELIPFVRVFGKYAFLEWYGNGGGENFYKKTSGGWKMFAGGGGAMQPEELHGSYGMPLSVAKALLRPC